MKYEMQREDVFSFAQAMGIETKEKGNECKLQYCPRCHSSGHGDQWTFSINLVSGAFCCPRASCGYAGHFVELCRDFDYDLGLTAAPYRELPQVKLLTTSPAAEYLFQRGIRKEITEQYNVTTSPDNPNQLIFPFYTRQSNADGMVYEKMEFVKYRLINYDPKRDGAKEWCEKDCKPILFGMNHCNPEISRTLVITEGQIDSLSVASAGIPNAVSVPNGARGFTWVQHCKSFVEQFDTIVAFGDCERGEITLVKSLRESFPNLKIRTPRKKDYLGEKDANDILRSYGEQAVRTCVEKAEQWTPCTIREMADVAPVSLDEIPHFRTMFPALDAVLGGFYAGQLITLTGKRGTGKSTFASMLAVAALWQDWKVLLYSGELADYEVKRWIDFQIAGEDAVQQKVYASNVSYYLDAAALRQIANWYRHKLYIVDNAAMAEQENCDLCTEIEQAVRAYGVQFVIVDNLMTALESEDELYRAQSKFVKRLKALAQKLQIVILLVAHPRKNNGKELDNDDISGSGDITNLSDTVISLDRTKPEQAKEPSKTLLSVRKNRATGVLLTGSERVEILHNKRSKRLYQKESKGGVYAFPFAAEACVEEKEPLPF